MNAKLIRRKTVSRKLNKAYDKIDCLLTEVGKKELPADSLEEINQRITLLNHFDGEEKILRKKIERFYSEILKLLKDQLGIVPRNYHQNIWMAYGLALFGLPIGVVMSTMTDTPAFMGVGLPIGLSIGMIYGMLKDRKVKMQNKQINIEG